MDAGPVKIGFDTETFPIRPGCLAPPVVCLTLAGRDDPPPFEEGADLVVERGADGWTVLVTRDVIAPVWRGLLDGALAGYVRLIAHNLAFDLAVLATHAPDTLPDVFAALDAGALGDTLIRESLIKIEEGTFRGGDDDDTGGRGEPLSALVAQYFGIDITASKTDPDAWRLRYSDLAGVAAVDYPPDAARYAVDDAVFALAVEEEQSAPRTGGAGAVLVSADGIVTDEAAQTRAAFALHLASCRGLAIDPVASETFEATVRADVERGSVIARDAGFVRPPAGWRTREGRCRLPPKGAGCGRISPKGAACAHCGYAGKETVDTSALRARVVDAFARLGMPVPLTDGGAVATDRDTLRKGGAVDPVLAEYAALGPAKKLLSTYVPVLLAAAREGGVVNHGFGVLVRSGRTSAFNPNTQNPPRSGGFRECFVPRPGFAYVSVDYDIAELKGLGQVQTWLFGASALADAINAGEDPHFSLGVDILSLRLGRPVSAEECKAAKAPDHPLHADMFGPTGARQLAKIANFGFPGGLGSGSFIEYAAGYGVILTPEESAELKAVWLAKWGIDDYFGYIAQLTANGYATIEAPVSGRQRGDVSFTAACNGFFQGIVADFAKAALYEVTRRAYAGEPGDPLAPDADGQRVFPVLFVHDEIIAEVRLGPGFTAAADALAACMVDVEQAYMPDLVASAAPAAMPRWYKGAKEARDAAGNLLIWTPTGNAPAE